jgi:hypothetical protein
MQALANELVGYLTVTDKAFKGSLAEHLCRIIQKFSPSVRWYVDMLLKVMLTAGAHVQVCCQYSCFKLLDVQPRKLNWGGGKFERLECVRLLWPGL